MFGGLPGSKQKIGQSFPRGTTMLFWQASAPVGWTKVASQNDKLLRVVSGLGGPLGGGGSNAFSTVNAQTVVGNTTLSAAQIPSITSWYNSSYTVVISPGSGTYSGFSTGASNYVPWNGAGYAYAGSLSSSNTSGGSHNHPITMNIAYVDLILASRN